MSHKEEEEDNRRCAKGHLFSKVFKKIKEFIAQYYLEPYTILQHKILLTKAKKMKCKSSVCNSTRTYFPRIRIPFFIGASKTEVQAWCS